MDERELTGAAWRNSGLCLPGELRRLRRTEAIAVAAWDYRGGARVG